jgi:hypothetical protein
MNKETRLRKAHVFVEMLVMMGYDEAWAFYCVAQLLRRDEEKK